jgi:hypothetical protein
VAADEDAQPLRRVLDLLGRRRHGNGEAEKRCLDESPRGESGHIGRDSQLLGIVRLATTICLDLPEFVGGTLPSRVSHGTALVAPVFNR